MKPTLQEIFTMDDVIVLALNTCKWSDSLPNRCRCRVYFYITLCEQVLLLPLLSRQDMVNSPWLPKAENEPILMTLTPKSPSMTKTTCLLISDLWCVVPFHKVVQHQVEHCLAWNDLISQSWMHVNDGSQDAGQLADPMGFFHLRILERH